MNPDSGSTVQIVAHRGASGYAPESTLEAFRLAIEMSVDYVEMDIHMLRDGTLVVIHDADVKRTTNGKGKLSELALPEVKALDAGSWFNKAYPLKARQEYIGLRVPTLTEVMDLISESSAGCCIEIKDPERYPAHLESELLAIVHKKSMEKRTRILSFSAASLSKIRVLDASIPTALLISRRTLDPVRKIMQIRANELAIRHDLATAAAVEAAHKNGISVSAWTVDNAADMQRMIRIGVDRIITNYPDRLFQQLKERTIKQSGSLRQV